MKRFVQVLLLLSIVLFSIASCEKMRPTPNAKLKGEFEVFKKWIDKSKRNKFNESLFCNNWVRSKVIEEIYVDGVLTETRDITHIFTISEFTLYEDHTIKGWSDTGPWQYSHNYIMWKLNGSYYMYEVVESRADALHLKEESFPQGGKVTPYYEDMSGRHRFWTYEYTVKE